MIIFSQHLHLKVINYHLIYDLALLKIKQIVFSEVKNVPYVVL